MAEGRAAPILALELELKRKLWCSSSEIRYNVNSSLVAKGVKSTPPKDNSGLAADTVWLPYHCCPQIQFDSG